MLSNVALSLRGIGKEEEAAWISRWALTLPADDTSVRHALWLAADEAARGEIRAAGSRLEGIDPSRLQNLDFFLHRVASATVEIQKAPREETHRAFARAQEEVREAESRFPTYRSVPALRRAFRRCIARIARIRGGPAAIAWHLRRF